MTLESSFRESVEYARQRLRQAASAGRPVEVHRRAAPVLELLDHARAEGIDASGPAARAKPA
ncbi:hypothetical protein [Pseudonocardia acaciae]|uniref:hypothetical protein n=1 Tax=Pseudonocardia acaciae TaxID=551276 RepID=UPI00048F46B3|nr:hypothetical protein [Pseudonocardia acaciae]